MPRQGETIMAVTSFKNYRVPTTFVIALVPAAVALNVVGNFINNALHLRNLLAILVNTVFNACHFLRGFVSKLSVLCHNTFNFHSRIAGTLR